MIIPPVILQPSVDGASPGDLELLGGARTLDRVRCHDGQIVIRQRESAATQLVFLEEAASEQHGIVGIHTAGDAGIEKERQGVRLRFEDAEFEIAGGADVQTDPS